MAPGTGAGAPPPAGRGVGGGQVPRLEVLENPQGEGVLLQMRGDDVSQVAVDVYCTESALGADFRKERVGLRRSPDGFFRGGPVALCDGDATTYFKASILMASSGGSNRSIVGSEARTSGAEIREAQLRLRRLEAEEREARLRAWRELPVDTPLTINRDSQHYFSRRTRAQGETDLLRLARLPAETEEMFFFIEGVDASGRPLSFWYEIGIRETRTHTEALLTGTFVKDVAAQFSRITAISYYHFHPRDADGTYGAEYPSDTDFKSAFGKLRPEVDPARLDDRVVTPTGVFVMRCEHGLAQRDPGGVQEWLGRYNEIFERFAAIVRGAFPDMPQAEKSSGFARLVTSQYAQASFQPLTEQGATGRDAARRAPGKKRR